MTSTNDGKDVKSIQSSGQKGKSYYIELYKSLDAQLNAERSARAVCAAWRRIHTLCQHSVPSTHHHLLAWIQRHTAHLLLQSEWQSPKSKEDHKLLEETIDAFLQECQQAIDARDGVSPPWEVQLRKRAEWIKNNLAIPWDHPVLRVLLDSRAEPPSTEEIKAWLREERGIMFVSRLRQLVASKCDDLAAQLVAAVMDRVRQDRQVLPDRQQIDDKVQIPAEGEEGSFQYFLHTEAGFTDEVWDLLTDIEFVLLHKSEKSDKVIELAKQTPLNCSYQLVERLQGRLTSSPREKKLWKNAKDVAILISQVVIARCMVIPECSGVGRGALYWCARALARLLDAAHLPRVAATLAAPAASPRHLHTFATAVHAQQSATGEMKPFVCELYVRTITFGMYELEKLKLNTEKEAEALSMEQTVASWFLQLGQLLGSSARMRCECALTAFSVHPAPHLYEKLKDLPLLPRLTKDNKEEPKVPESTNSEFGSWATDSRSQTNFVKTSETLNLKQTQQQANVLSTAILNEGESLGIDADLCQDIAVLLSGPRVKTLSWDMDREVLLENCRVYMARRGGGTRALTTELRYLNLDPAAFAHLPEEDDDENDAFYGIEKGYEHHIEFEPQPEEIWQSGWDVTTEATDSSSTEIYDVVPKRKNRSRKVIESSSDDDSDPLSLVAAAKRTAKKKERPHSKERSKHKEKKKSRSKEHKDRSVSKERQKERSQSQESHRSQSQESHKDRSNSQESRKKTKKERKKKDKKEKAHNIDTSMKELLSLKVGLKVENYEALLKSSERPTDIDNNNSQASSPSTHTDVEYDGQYSMDELTLKSPDRPVDNTPKMTDLSKRNELSISGGKVSLNKMASPQQPCETKLQMSTKIDPTKHLTEAELTSSKLMREQIKQSISKLIQFRKQKERMEKIVTTQSSQSKIMEATATMAGVVGSKVLKMPTNLQHSEPKILKKNVKAQSAKTCGKSCSRTSPFISNGTSSKATPQSTATTPRTEQSQTITKSSLCRPDGIKIKPADSRDQLTGLFIQNIAISKSPSSNKPANVSQTHLNSYEKFLKELQNRRNSDGIFDTTKKDEDQPNKGKETTPKSSPKPETGNKVDPTEHAANVKETEGKQVQVPLEQESSPMEQERVCIRKEIRPMHRVPAIVVPTAGSPPAGRPTDHSGVSVTSTVTSSPTKPATITSQSAKPQQNKPDNAPSTFARLSYMHKNKQSEKPRLSNSESSDRLHQQITAELDRRIADLKIAKILQSNSGLVVSRVSGHINNNPKVEVQQEPSGYLSVANPFPSGILEKNFVSNTVNMPETYVGMQQKAPEVTKISTQLFEKTPKVSPASKDSALCEKDQHDLILLLRQQNKMNTPQPKQNQQSTVLHTSPGIQDASILNIVHKMKPKQNQESAILHTGQEIQEASILNIIQGTSFRPEKETQQPMTATKQQTTSGVIPTRKTQKTRIAKLSKPKQPPKLKNTGSLQAAKKNEDCLNVNKSISKTYPPNTLSIGDLIKSKEKPNDAPEQEWSIVLDALRAQKTPSRGPNAIDVFLKKDSFEKYSEKKQSESVGNVLRAVTVSKVEPSIQVGNTVQFSTSSIAINKQIPKPSMPKTTATGMPNIPKKQTPFVQTAVEPSKQFVQNINKEDDPFISGIPNSDYENLEELMDDDLRQEIAELFSDEENFPSVDFGPQVSSNTSRAVQNNIIVNKPELVLKKPEIHKGPAAIKIPIVAPSMKTDVNEKPKLSSKPTSKLKILSNEKVELFKPTETASKIVTHLSSTAISKQTATSFEYNSTSQSGVPSQKMFVTAIPPPAPSVVVIRPEVIYEQPFSLYCNVNPPYATNINLYQQEPQPQYRPLIFGNTIALATVRPAVNISVDNQSIPQNVISAVHNVLPNVVISSSESNQPKNAMETVVNQHMQDPFQNIASVSAQNNQSDVARNIKPLNITHTTTQIEQIKTVNESFIPKNIILCADKLNISQNVVSAAQAVTPVVINPSQTELLQHKNNDANDENSVTNPESLISVRTQKENFTNAKELTTETPMKNQNVEKKEYLNAGAIEKSQYAIQRELLSDSTITTANNACNTEVQQKAKEQNFNVEPSVDSPRDVSKMAAQSVRNIIKSEKSSFSLQEGKINPINNQIHFDKVKDIENTPNISWQNDLIDTNIDLKTYNMPPQPKEYLETPNHKTMDNTNHDTKKAPQITKVKVQEPIDKIGDKITDSSNNTQQASPERLVPLEKEDPSDNKTGSKQDSERIRLKRLSILNRDVNHQCSQLPIPMPYDLLTSLRKIPDLDIKIHTRKHQENKITETIASISMPYTFQSMSKEETSDLGKITSHRQTKDNAITEMNDAKLDQFEKSSESMFTDGKHQENKVMETVAVPVPCVPSLFKEELSNLSKSTSHTQTKDNAITEMDDAKLDQVEKSSESMFTDDKHQENKVIETVAIPPNRFKEELSDQSKCAPHSVTKDTTDTKDSKLDKVETSLESTLSEGKYQENRGIETITPIPVPCGHQSLVKEDLSDLCKITSPFLGKGKDITKENDAKLDPVEKSFESVFFEAVNPCTPENNSMDSTIETSKENESTLRPSNKLLLKAGSSASAEKAVGRKTKVRLKNKKSIKSKNKTKSQTGKVLTEVPVEKEPNSDNHNQNTDKSQATATKSKAVTVDRLLPIRVSKRIQTRKMKRAMETTADLDVEKRLIVDKQDKNLSNIQDSNTHTGGPIASVIRKDIMESHTMENLKISEEKDTQTADKAVPSISNASSVAVTNSVLVKSNVIDKIDAKTRVSDINPTIKENKIPLYKPSTKDKLTKLTEDIKSAINEITESTVGHLIDDSNKNHMDKHAVCEKAVSKRVVVQDTAVHNNRLHKIPLGISGGKTDVSLDRCRTEKPAPSMINSVVAKNKLSTEKIILKGTDNKKQSTNQAPGVSTPSTTEKTDNLPKKPNESHITNIQGNSNQAIPQSYKDSIIIEELPNPDPNPNKKVVRIKLPTGRVMKATVYGHTNVSFDVLFQNPALKNILLSGFSDKRRYTLSIPTSAPSREYDAADRNDTPRKIETVNLVSDDEEEPPPVMKFSTEYGQYKIKSMDADLFKKHQAKFRRKCFIGLDKYQPPPENNVIPVSTIVDPDSDVSATSRMPVSTIVDPDSNVSATSRDAPIVFDTITSNQTMVPVTNQSVTPNESILPINPVVITDRTVLPLIYPVITTTETIVPLTNQVEPQLNNTVPGVIEIDDSSNDSIQILENSELNPAEKISSLKNLLLKDLGVVDDVLEIPTKPTIDKNTSNTSLKSLAEDLLKDLGLPSEEMKGTKPRESTPNTDKGIKYLGLPSEEMKGTKLRESTPNTDKGIPLPTKISTRECFVKLIRCDDMLEYKMNVLCDERPEISYNATENVGDSPLPELTRSGSFSLLNDLVLDEEPVSNAARSSPIIDVFESTSYPQVHHARNSPVMEAYDMIFTARFSSKICETTEERYHLWRNSIPCHSEWFSTKSSMRKEIEDLRTLYGEILDTKTDSSTDCESDLEWSHENIENNVFEVSDLKTITAKYFEDNPLVTRLKTSCAINIENETALQRIEHEQGQIEAKVDFSTDCESDLEWSNENIENNVFEVRDLKTITAKYFEKNPLVTRLKTSCGINIENETAPLQRNEHEEGQIIAKADFSTDCESDLEWSHEYNVFEVPDLKTIVAKYFEGNPLVTRLKTSCAVNVENAKAPLQRNEHEQEQIEAKADFSTNCVSDLERSHKNIEYFVFEVPDLKTIMAKYFEDNPLVSRLKTSCAVNIEKEEGPLQLNALEGQIEAKADSSTDRVSDLGWSDENIEYNVFEVPCLKTIIAKYFEDNPLVSRLKTSCAVNIEKEEGPLQRNELEEGQIEAKADSSTDCVSDLGWSHENIEYNVFEVPCLKTIMAKYFEDNPLVTRLKTSCAVNAENDKAPLQRNEHEQEHIEAIADFSTDCVSGLESSLLTHEDVGGSVIYEAESSSKICETSKEDNLICRSSAPCHSEWFATKLRLRQEIKDFKLDLNEKVIDTNTDSFTDCESDLELNHDIKESTYVVPSLKTVMARYFEDSILVTKLKPTCEANTAKPLQRNKEPIKKDKEIEPDCESEIKNSVLNHDEVEDSAFVVPNLKLIMAKYFADNPVVTRLKYSWEICTESDETPRQLNNEPELNGNKTETPVYSSDDSGSDFKNMSSQTLFLVPSLKSIMAKHFENNPIVDKLKSWCETAIGCENTLSSPLKRKMQNEHNTVGNKLTKLNRSNKEFDGEDEIIRVTNDFKILVDNCQSESKLIKFDRSGDAFLEKEMMQVNAVVNKMLPVNNLIEDILHPVMNEQNEISSERHVEYYDSQNEILCDGLVNNKNLKPLKTKNNTEGICLESSQLKSESEHEILDKNCDILTSFKTAEEVIFSATPSYTKSNPIVSETDSITPCINVDIEINSEKHTSSNTETSVQNSELLGTDYQIEPCTENTSEIVAVSNNNDFQQQTNESGTPCKSQELLPEVRDNETLAICKGMIKNSEIENGKMTPDDNADSAVTDMTTDIEKYDETDQLYEKEQKIAVTEIENENIDWISHETEISQDKDRTEDANISIDESLIFMENSSDKIIQTDMQDNNNVHTIVMEDSECANQDAEIATVMKESYTINDDHKYFCHTEIVEESFQIQNSPNEGACNNQYIPDDLELNITESKGFEEPYTPESTNTDDTLDETISGDKTALIYANDGGVILKGIEYDVPDLGTCYIFPPVKTSGTSTPSEILDSESVEVDKTLDICDNEQEEDSQNPSDDDLQLIEPKVTYERAKRKRKSTFSELKLSVKRRRQSKMKGKNIDSPKLTCSIKRGISCGEDYDRILDYYDTIEFSYSVSFSETYIEVPDLIRNWPIKEPCPYGFDLETKMNSDLFTDNRRCESDPTEMTLAEEITNVCKQVQDEGDLIPDMGFGEGSGRVIQNLRDVSNLKFSAATLSDVKPAQPFLLSERRDCFYNFQIVDNQDQLEKIRRSINYLQLRDKVRTFFKSIAIELNNSVITNIKDKHRQDGKVSSFPFDFTLQTIVPSPVEVVVQVVQVGQLPVSAAAQNPVTCDPRVTQVSDASPSQCSVDNSPQDDSQSHIKTEYTELTTAELTLPMMQEYAQHNQAINQESSQMSISNENIPIETEITEEHRDEIEIKDEVEAKSEQESEVVVEEDRRQPIYNHDQKNLHVNNTEYDYETNNGNETHEVNSEIGTEQNPPISHSEKEPETYTNQRATNGPPEKTDQIAHAMSAAGITTTEDTMTNNTTSANAFVNLLSQKLLKTSMANQNTVNCPKTINLSLQQALAQILPPPLNQTNTADTQQNQSSLGAQVLHIVGKNAAGNQITLVENPQQSVINAPNATPVLHIVHNKPAAAGPTSNGVPAQQNTFSGLSIVDTGLQQGGNQLLHIVNAGNQKNNNAGQLLKRVNLLTNIANVQGSNEQKMVQFVCKSADGKSIQLNAPHQRGMVLRLQPIETPQTVPPATTKPPENPELSPPPNAAAPASNKDSQQEIKSRSIYEENYAKFIQNVTPKTQLLEKSTSLPKFNQAFGKFQEGNQKQNDIDNNLQPMNTSVENSECSPQGENSINLDHMRLPSPPLLVRKQQQPTSQPQQNLVQQIKQTIAPMNIQTMHGGVIYTRQIPVNIGGGQTINLITVPSTELIDESGQKQQGEIESPIIKIVPQAQVAPNAEVTADEGNNQNSATNENQNQPQQQAQPQPVLTQMRIKLPMLSKTPQMVPGARVVRPSFFQIQRNVIGGANQPVYQQLVLTAAPPLGQQTIRLPQTQVRPVKVESQTSSEPQMSTSTLEQLREFDMVLEQVKAGQPNSGAQFKLNTSSTDTTDSSVSTSSASTETTQVFYSINNQPLNVTYVNRKATVTAPTTSTFAGSPDSSGIIDSSSSSNHVQITHTATPEASTSEANVAPPKPKFKSKSKPKHHHNSVKVNNSIPPKVTTQKPIEDEQTTQRILYILAEYKEQVENSPDKDKPAPRRRSNPPTNPGSSKRKKSSSSRKSDTRDTSPVQGEDGCRTMGSEDSSCGTSQGDCAESCIDSQSLSSPQESPRKVARKLTFEQDSPLTPPASRPQPQRNVIVADGQTITVARGTAGGKPTTATVLMPANYILPLSMVKGGQQIAIVTNRGPKLLTVGGGEGGATNALLLQRLIGPAGAKPVLTRPGVRHVRLPTAALHNLQAFNLATNVPDSTASSVPATPPDLIETQTSSSPWTDRGSESTKHTERASSPEGSEPWHLPTDYGYEETVRADNLDRTVLDAIPDRYSPDMEAQRIFDKMFDVESKKSYIVDSPRCGYDIDPSDCDDRSYQVVQKKDGHHRQHRLAHVSSAALRHKYAILEHELRLQKSLSEECEDLGVDSPSASELFPEAELLFTASPAHDHAQDAPHHSNTPQPTIINQSSIQPDIDDQIATDHLLQQTVVHDGQQELGMGLEDVGIVTVSEDGLQATITLDQEEFARSHPNTTFHTEPPTEDVEVQQPFTITGLKGRQITSTIYHANRAPATVLMAAPQTTVISQAAAPPHTVKYANIDNIIDHVDSIPVPHNNINNNVNLSSVLVKDDGLTRFDSILTDSRELHLSNTASAIVHNNATQVIRRVCYEEDKRDRDTSFLMDEPDALIAGDDAKMVAEDSSRDATLESMTGDVDDDNSSTERHGELFWESNSTSERSDGRRPLDFSSDSDKCCKSPSYDETNSTDSSGVGTHMRLDSVIKEARLGRSGSADVSSDDHPPLRTYPPKRMYNSMEGEMERSLSGKTRAGERSPDLEVRRRHSGRGVVKRGCHCCNGSPAPPRPKKPRQRKPNMEFTDTRH